MQATDNPNLPILSAPEPKNQIELYVSLSKGIKVREMGLNDLEKLCQDSISLAFINSGRNAIPAGDQKILEQLFYNDLKNIYPAATDLEIKKAMDLGSKGMATGQFEKVYGINPAAWNEWIFGFLRHETRLLALKPKPKPKTTNEPTEAEKKEMLRSFYNLINSMYLNHCAGLNILDHYAIPYAYNTLLEKKLIDSKFDEDLKEYALDFLRNKNERTINKADKIKEDSEAWISELSLLCKGLRVKQAFTKMHSQKFDLGEFLKTKI